MTLAITILLIALWALFIIYASGVIDRSIDKKTKG
jgi:hypothetical protein